MTHLLGKAALPWLGGHVKDVAVDVDLPAVIETAQAGFFIAAQRE